VLNDPAASERKRASQIPYLRREVRVCCRLRCLAAAAAACDAAAATDRCYQQNGRSTALQVEVLLALRGTLNVAHLEADRLLS